MQALQLVAPTELVAVPIGHGVQSGLWAVDENVPTWQLEHEVAPEGEEAPGGHAVHALLDVAPADALCVPAGQGRHDVAEVAPSVEL